MIKIPLNHGLETMVDDIDADLALEPWHAVVSEKTHYVIRNVRVDGEWATTARMHRIIMARVLGRTLSEDELVDHKDRDGLNNCRSNLRLADRSQNRANSPRNRNNTSGAKGVSPFKDKWKVQITVQGKNLYLGLFSSKEEASRVYNAAALRHFGEHAYLNPTKGSAS